MNTWISTSRNTFAVTGRKDFNCQVAMVPMIEKWKKARDNGEHAGGVMYGGRGGHYKFGLKEEKY